MNSLELDAHSTQNSSTSTFNASCETCPSRNEPALHTLAEEAPLKIHRRFDRFARLVGDQGVSRVSQAHVIVFGCGGVGSFAAEALARSGVGHITLVDFDLICITNTNRQLHAMKGTVGKPKVDVMAERLKLIHPTAHIEPIRLFYEASTRDVLLPEHQPAPTFVIDAIDNITAKLDLIATCVRRNIPIVSSMGAAGRLDPTRVRIADLAHTIRDGLAREVRKLLLRQHQIPLRDDGTFGIPAVFSDENLIPPAQVHADTEYGFLCVCPHGENQFHSCDRRARIDGTASFVTGTFGLVAASYVVRAIANPAEAKRTTVTPRKGSKRKHLRSVSNA